MSPCLSTCLVSDWVQGSISGLNTSNSRSTHFIREWSMVFGFEPGTLLVKGDCSDRGSIAGTITYEASARCLSFQRALASNHGMSSIFDGSGVRITVRALALKTLEFAPTLTVLALKALDPGFKPGNDPGCETLSLSVRTESYGYGCSGSSAAINPAIFGSGAKTLTWIRLVLRQGLQTGIRYSLTGKIHRMGLKTKDLSFKKGGIRPGFATGILRLWFEPEPNRVSNLKSMACMASAQTGLERGIHS
ncbi:hypothetical protein DPMN_136160 [Dreissena polymorpha]|uniref:Uncharacterized protein n=1 Tax=Dreissena polymorpha TaxID=45954 RepID=A0A9D4G599_DREPO|nr:hypothetical protein DPMN_136160 [Dreissena polymorpha]